MNQLQAAVERNLSTMIYLEESGPFICVEPPKFANGSKNPHAKYHVTCADDCSTFGVDAWKYDNASTAPVRGACGLRWLSRTLDYVRPFVANGTLEGFMLGDELSTGGWPREQLIAASALIHSSQESGWSVLSKTVW